MSAKRRGGRPAKPKVLRNRDGSKSVRTTMTIEGERVRRQMKVGTSDYGVARVRGARLAAGEAPELIKRQRESFKEAAERILPARHISTGKNRRSRLERYAYPIIGNVPVDEIKVGDVRECLEAMRKVLGWTGAVRHLKNDISAILGALYTSDIIQENAALRIKFNKKKGTLGDERLERVVLPRIVLSDEEFAAFIAYGLELGSDQGRGGELSELYMLALCARCLGGMRTSDLHAWRYEHIDTRGWLTAEVPRPKTMGNLDEFGEASLEPYELTGEAAVLVPYLAAWWRRHGCPSEGPVFPVRRGKRAGLHKDSGTSYAKVLRQALWAAGICRPKPSFAQAVALHGRFSEQARQLCALQSGIARRRAMLDFHSFRRGWVTATTSKEAGLSFSESMRMSDHSDPATHQRYRRQEGSRVIPRGVLPLALPKLPAHPSEILHDNGRARRDSNARPTASESAGRASLCKFTEQTEGAMHPNSRPETTQRQNSLPKLDALNQAVEALRALGQNDMASALLEREMPDRKAPVVKLSEARRRK